MSDAARSTHALIISLWDFSDPAASEARLREALAEAERLNDAARRLEIITQIARALGLQRKFDAAHALLDEVEAALRSTVESDAGRVRLHLERGRIFNSQQHGEAGQPLFERAWDEARLKGLDALAVDAAHMVAIVHSATSPDEALRWNRLAMELAEASVDPFARKWAASLHNNVGWTLHDAGRAGEALPHFERALELRLVEGDERATRIARWCIARCLRSLGRVAEALQHQRELLHEVESTGAAADGYIEEEIGECLLVLGRADEASGHLARAHELLAADPWLLEREPGRLERLRDLGGLAQ